MMIEVRIFSYALSCWLILLLTEDNFLFFNEKAIC